MKKCTMCGMEKSVDQFNKDNRNKTDGLVARCKECCKKIAAKHYKKNQEKIKKQTAAYRSENIEEVRRKDREYREAKRSAEKGVKNG